VINNVDHRKFKPPKTPSTKVSHKSVHFALGALIRIPNGDGHDQDVIKIACGIDAVNPLGSEVGAATELSPSGGDDSTESRREILRGINTFEVALRAVGRCVVMRLLYVGVRQRIRERYIARPQQLPEIWTVLKVRIDEVSKLFVSAMKTVLKVVVTI
jgi:hypothetical protein